jgi:hypothetical protein
MKHQKYKKKVKAHRKTQEHSQSEVKLKAFVQSVIFVVRHIHMYTDRQRIALRVSWCK